MGIGTHLLRQFFAKLHVLKIGMTYHCTDTHVFGWYDRNSWIIAQSEGDKASNLWGDQSSRERPTLCISLLYLGQALWQYLHVWSACVSQGKLMGVLSITFVDKASFRAQTQIMNQTNFSGQAQIIDQIKVMD